MTNLNEKQRITCLRNLKLLDTSPSESFDRITRLASELFHLPIAAVSLTDSDRQWFKSKVGVEHNEIPRHKAPCAAVAETNALLVVEDMKTDPFYCDSHLAGAGVRFYAGAPLITRDGFGLGALCVLGVEPRLVTTAECDALTDMASMVMDQIELQRAVGRIDATTGLPNRFQLLDDLAGLNAQASGKPRLISVVDLAENSQIANLARVLGASHFDNILRRLASIIARRVGEGRVLYHVGPTQFVVIAPDEAELGPYQEYVVSELRRLERLIDVAAQMTPSIGILCYEPEAMSPENVLRSLQSAVHEARASHNGVALFSAAADLRYQHNYRLLKDFSAASKADDQLFLVFQPRMSLNDDSVQSAEALLRWKHPEFGLVSPADFVPIVETSSYVKEMTAWVIDAALKKLGEWNASGFRMRLSINISAANLCEPDFLDRLDAKLTAYSVLPSQIEFELTETEMMKETGSAMDLLHKIADLGIGIAIDDFGTGYSSLTRMQKLPADVIKIDRSFIADMAEGNKERVLVQSMISLSHSLGYRVVAEGVESKEVADLLQAMRCDEIQGFWLSRPLQGDMLIRWLCERHALTLAQIA
ncbi:putative bifunctional diguanylate cyclase/phosphodiesterase [Oryzifoliimicrobium ureilyticus]|uniref:putative bifunctional diguanylate cyclase/phosphodiesterase n=1 Tax=Oryzifoliimicrobium ureilyticus TaxID=3113724 RepID=UPI0030761C5D